MKTPPKDSAVYKLIQDRKSKSWRVKRNGSVVSRNHAQKWAARLEALKEADRRREIAIIEGGRSAAKTTSKAIQNKN